MANCGHNSAGRAKAGVPDSKTQRRVACKIGKSALVRLECWFLSMCDSSTTAQRNKPGVRRCACIKGRTSPYEQMTILVLRLGKIASLEDVKT